MKALLSLLPAWVPVAALGVLLAGLVGGFFALRASWQAEGAARVEAANVQAVLAQKEKDARLSAEIISQQQAKLAQLSARAGAALQRIDNAPKTTGCGPVMRDASRGVRELLLGAGQPPAGR
jgi:hypothetical protein